MRTRYQTGDQALVREINLSTILRYLQEGAPLSRAGLANLTGLNKTTVSSLVEELIDRGLLYEVGLDNSSVGRPATLLDLNPQAGGIVGAALGVDFISVILTDLVGNIQWRRVVDVDPYDGQEKIIGQTLEIVDRAIEANHASGARLLGLGLAVPATVEVNEGLLVFSPNLQWQQVPLGQIFHAHTAMPVMVDNDANASAVAEHLFGVARRVQNFISIFAGVGIGGGLFLNGRLYRGAGGFAGEIGHTSFMVQSYRPHCRCGNRGCWEAFANQNSVVERVRSRLVAGRSSLIPDLMRDEDSPLTVSLIIRAAEAGDQEAAEALTETGAMLGLGVANLINIFNPEMVVIGGSLSAAADYMLPAIKQAVQETAMPEISRQARILLSAFGPDASVMGAVSLVVEAILNDPLSVERVPQRLER